MKTLIGATSFHSLLSSPLQGFKLRIDLFLLAGFFAPDVYGHGIALAFERVDPVQDAGGEQHQAVHHQWDRDHRAECG